MMIRKKKGHLQFYQFPDLAAEKNLFHFVTTRIGGVSTSPYNSLNLALHVGDEKACVLENRKRALGAFGLRLEELVCCKQTHGGKFAFVDKGFWGRGAYDDSDAVSDCDALITRAKRAVLSVYSADCPLAILYHRPDTLAVLHLGWRCILGGLGAAVLRFMTDDLNCAPSAIKGGISPGVGPLSYKVEEDFAARFKDANRPTDCIIAKKDGCYFDLAKAAFDQIVSSGVPAGNIKVSGMDSFVLPEEFYSYRRDGVTGRFALMAALK